MFDAKVYDSIDLGSSKVSIVNSEITGSGDKGVSCGEGSEVVLFNSSIEDAAIGVASKDDSVITIINCDIENNDLGLSSYIKKDFWQKPGKIHVYNSVLKNKQDMDLSDGSYIILKNSLISEDLKDLGVGIVGHRRKLRVHP